MTGGTPLTVVTLVAPTNQRLRITEYEFSFDGTNTANTPASITCRASHGRHLYEHCRGACQNQ